MACIFANCDDFIVTNEDCTDDEQEISDSSNDSSTSLPQSILQQLECTLADDEDLSDYNNDCSDKSGEKSYDEENIHSIDEECQSYSSDYNVTKHIENTEIKTRSNSNYEYNKVQCNVILPDYREYKCKIDRSDTISNLLDIIRENCGYSKFDKFDVFYIIDYNHKIWLSNDKSIEKQIVTISCQLNFKLRLVAAIYLWKFNIRLKRIGHLSIKLYDNTYISHWPNKLRIKWNKHSEQHITLEDDIKAEKGNPDEVLYLECVNFLVSRQNRIINWWNKHKSNWNLLTNNCAQKVHNSLMICSFFTNKKLARPTAVFNYVKLILQKCHKLRDKYNEEFNDFNQFLMNKKVEYKELIESIELKEMQENAQTLDKREIIKQLKISHELIKQQQQIIERSTIKDYHEYELLKMINEIIEKINISDKLRNEQINQIKDVEKSKECDELAVLNRLMQELKELKFSEERDNNSLIFLEDLSSEIQNLNEFDDNENLNIFEFRKDMDVFFDIRRVNIRPIKFNYKLLNEIKADNLLNLELICVNMNMIMNKIENREISEMYNKFMRLNEKRLKVNCKQIEKNEKIKRGKQKKIGKNLKKMKINKKKLKDNRKKIVENDKKIVVKELLNEEKKLTNTLIEENRKLRRDNKKLRKENYKLEKNNAMLDHEMFAIFHDNLKLFDAQYYYRVLSNTPFFSLKENDFVENID